MAAGGRMSTVHLINLRTVLSYLEIGNDLASIPGGEHPMSLEDSTGLFEIALNRIRGDRPLYLEFGVFEGRSLRWWSEHLTTPGARLVGFDSFEGLPENWWPGLDKGNFATGGPPTIEDSRVSFEVGWFDETLRHFAPPEHDHLVINIDCDLYSSAATVLPLTYIMAAPGHHPATHF